MTHTITSDEVRCPKCLDVMPFIPSHEGLELLAIYTNYGVTINCEYCDIDYRVSKAIKFECTEVLND